MRGQDDKFEMKVVIDVKVEVKIKFGIEIDNEGSVQLIEITDAVRSDIEICMDVEINVQATRNDD